MGIPNENSSLLSGCPADSFMLKSRLFIGWGVAQNQFVVVVVVVVVVLEASLQIACARCSCSSIAAAAAAVADGYVSKIFPAVTRSEVFALTITFFLSWRKFSPIFNL